ncbi:MAG: DNA-processing protein DprA [Candidatus Saccharimonadales bacterium]
MNVNSLKHDDSDYPQILKNIPDAPKQLFWTGSPMSEWLDCPKVAIVGSRKASAYGRQVTTEITGQLARTGVIIISGLAYGIDSIAHQVALEAGGRTVAVLPTGLDKIYPAAHQNLARQITDSGGTLISEYAPGSEVFKLNFIARNRIVSGLSDALLITAAAINSGSLHTAQFALAQGKTVMAVPGNITSPGSVGCNNLIKSGAVPVTDVDDVFFTLNIKSTDKIRPKPFRGSGDEEKVLQLIRQGLSAQEDLAQAAGLTGPVVASALTMLEISGYIRPAGGGQWLAV